MTGSGGTSGDDRDLVTDLAQLVLAEVSPEELPIFDETATEYFADPEGVLAPRRQDEAVGFGLDLALMTPYLLAMATAVVHFLTTVVAESAKEEAKPVVRDHVRRLFRRVGLSRAGDTKGTSASPEGPAIDRHEAGQVHAVARQEAQRLGLPTDRAELLANAIVGRLMVSG